MTKKSFSVIFITLCISLLQLSAQNPPSFSEIDTIEVYLGSGTNHFLVPGVSDGDGNSQSIAFSAESGNNNLISVLSVDYTTGNKTALLSFAEKKVAGLVFIRITAQDSDAAYTDSLCVKIVPYSNPGATFQIHDAVFWQEVVPLNLVPVYEQWIATGEGPFDQLNYDEIPLTVNGDCTQKPPCTGHDFYTAFYQGYFVPPATGQYTFYMQGENNFTLFLSSDDNYDNAVQIIYKGSAQPVIGTSVANNQYRAVPVLLQEGIPYAFYGAQWIIHATYGGILVEGPGIAKSFVPGEFMMPVFDPVKPAAPGSLVSTMISSDKAILNWNPSTDNSGITEYEIFINGTLYSTLDGNTTSLEISGLDAGSTYTMAVRSKDKMGNYSLYSNLLTINTWVTESNPPTPPVSLQTLVSTGVSVKLRWFGASDAESAVIGYNLYLGDTLYNLTGPVYADSIILRNLQPSTESVIRIEAIDASYNISEKSEAFTFSTSGFDPYGPDLGEKIARLHIIEGAISSNYGIGLNGPYESGQMVNDPEVRKLVSDFGAGAIRWGGIGANSKSLSGSSGTGKSNTYAKMLSFANEIDAWFALAVGVMDGLDYRTDLNTFANLLEYLEGPSSTVWGAKRAAEGYPDPLISAGRGIILEFGNEVWGADAHDAQIGNDLTAYGNWCRDAAEVIMNSPYYDENKIILTYSGRNPHPNSSYGVNDKVLKGDTGQIQCLAVSGYLGGNLDYDPDLPAWNSELQYFKHRIAQVAYDVDGFQLTLKDAMAETGTLFRYYLYESNATTSSYNGRLGQAVVMMDLFAESMKYGSIVPSVFHLTGGEWKITRPAENYRLLPLYIAGREFNKYCKGDVLLTSLETKQKITDGFGTEMNWNPVGTSAYLNGENLSILLLSRDFENDYTVEVNMPEGFNYTGNVAVMTYSADDFGAIDMKLDSVLIPFQDKMLVNVPKFGMVFLSLVDFQSQPENLPLGYFTHVKAESVSLTPRTQTDITINYGRNYFDAVVHPDNAFFRSIGFKLDENGVNVQQKVPYASTIYVKGTGTCDGNGMVTLTAFAMEDPEINTSLDIHISNQGIDCPTGITEQKLSSMFYPNPALNFIEFESFPGARVVISDIYGKTLLEKTLDNSSLINLESLSPGIYIVSLSYANETLTSRLIKN